MAEYMDFEILSFEENEEFKSECEKKGVNGCLEFLERKNSQWKTVPLKVGVIGSTGVGKSSFINAVRGLRSKQKGAARVGVTESTRVPTEYPHPNNEMLKFWDLPGVGSPNFLKDNYLAQIGVDSYDCFIIMTATRFTETDLWLAKEIGERKKNFYFVRTKISYDVDNDKYENGPEHNEAEVLQTIRQDTIEQLNENGFTNQVFLIDNHKRAEYDFDKLQQTIITDLPALKRQAMILSLSACTDKMIKLKAEELRKRAWIVALASATVSAIPLPGLSIAFDAATLITEIKFYYEQLGLDEASLRRRADLMSVEYDVLAEIMRRDFPQVIGAQLLISLATTGGYAVGMVVEEVARFIPFVGAFIAAPISLAFTKFSLNYMLDKMEKTSLELTTYF